MSPIIIRTEEPLDVSAIGRVIVEAFGNTPHSERTEQFIVRDLRLASGLTVSVVAEAHGHVVGHLAVSPVRIGNGVDRWFGVGPISVHPARQGKGIGTQLMNAALEQLRAPSANGCVVLGKPRYYGGFGFSDVAGRALPSVPAEYFQAVVLGSIAPQGEVSYHQAFQAKQ